MSISSTLFHNVLGHSICLPNPPALRISSLEQSTLLMPTASLATLALVPSSLSSDRRLQALYLEELRSSLETGRALIKNGDLLPVTFYCDHARLVGPFLDHADRQLDQELLEATALCQYSDLS